MPHDCDFLTAPLGQKNCRYNKRVLTVRVQTSASNARLVSYDEGQTWQKADPSIKPAIFVSWEKIPD